MRLSSFDERALDLIGKLYKNEIIRRIQIILSFIIYDANFASANSIVDPDKTLIYDFPPRTLMEYSTQPSLQLELLD